MAGIQGTHDRHAGHSVAMFRDKFWLSLAFTIPVVLWSSDVQHWLGYTAPSFPGSEFIPAVFGTLVFLYGGLVFIRGARGELADRNHHRCCKRATASRIEAPITTGMSAPGGPPRLAA